MIRLLSRLLRRISPSSELFAGVAPFLPAGLIDQYRIQRRPRVRRAGQRAVRPGVYAAGVNRTHTLEPRVMLSAYVVDTIADDPAAAAGDTDGSVSLREAIQAANTNAAFGDAVAGSSTETDTITFAESLAGQTITLGGQRLTISDGLSITGLGANRLTIDANEQSRVFHVTGSDQVQINAVTISGGSASGGGGGIVNTGNLVLDGVIVRANTAGLGGGIISLGSLVTRNSTFAGNSAQQGGAINVQASSATIVNTTISGNHASDLGGGIITFATVNITNSTITGNRADIDGSGTNFGGGLFVEAGTTTLHNTIVAGNTSGTSDTPSDINGSVSVFNGSQNNIIGDANSAGGLTDSPLGFPNNIVGNNGSGVRAINTILDTTLQNNGGAVPTHALVDGSLAINGGNNFLALDENGSTLTTDGRGVPFARFGAATANADMTVDIGAFERQPRFVVNTLEDETNDDSTFSLREAINAANAQDIGSNVGGRTDLITFDPLLAGGTIVLDDGQLSISGRTEIRGLGADQLTISGDNQSRIFGVNTGATAEISGLTLMDGFADHADGGAIFSRGETTLRGLWITQNEASFDGGGVYQSTAGTLDVFDSTISDNVANDDGGGIYTGHGAQIVNSTVSGNRANDNGGGIFNFDRRTTIRNSTITNNRADSDGNSLGTGGGIWTINDGITFTEVFNSIVAGNFVGTGSTANDVDNKNLEANSSNNLIGDANSAGGLTDGQNGNIVGDNGSGVRPINSVLDTTLRNNGGPTPTHVLGFMSPALNAGGPTALNNDQRGPGFARIIDGIVDIGAVEGETIVVTTANDENDGTGDPNVGTGTSLREAILTANASSNFTTIRFDAELDGVPINIGLAGAGEDGGLSGDFDITSVMAILGNGTGQTIINANGLDRIFDVRSPGASIAFLSVTGGSVLTEGGGAIRNAGGGQVNLFDVHVSDSQSLAGGVQNFVGNMSIGNSQISGNTAFVIGGGVSNEGGTLTVDGTLVTNNDAASEGGGLWNQSGQTLTITNSGVIGNTAAGNDADNGGGGIFNNGGAIFGFNNGVFDNEATGANGSGGGIMSVGGFMALNGFSVDRNKAQRAGGGIEVISGTVEIFSDGAQATISGNQALGNGTGSGSGNGGGLNISGQGANVTLTNTQVLANLATNEGGGLWNQVGSTLTIDNSQVNFNAAIGDNIQDGGGGLYNEGGTVNITDSTISGNWATGANGEGGGILTVAGTVTILGSEITTNTAHRAGGGIEIVNGNLDFRDGFIAGNFATGSASPQAPGDGGGLHVSGNNASVFIQFASISNNTAANAGGAIWTEAGSTVEILNANIDSNEAAGLGGGAIFNNGGAIFTANATITSNSASSVNGSGGAIFNAGGFAQFFNTIFEFNTNDGERGAVFNNAQLTLLGDTRIENNPAGGLFTAIAGVSTLNGATIINNNLFDITGPGTVN